MAKPLVSIIIPCYNSGAYLPEAIASVVGYPNKEAYEIIIVDDGSTDARTLSLLCEFKETCLVIRQENMGPAAARNTGIASCQGEYILFLDSDNKIKSSYLDRGIEILNTHQDVGVVYSDVCFFGDTDEPRFTSRAFNEFDIIYGNYIDMCSMIRKKVWEEVGGLDENRLLIGHEDWEFWIRVGATGWKFQYIADALFEYRVREDSLVKQATQPDKYQQMMTYVHEKNLPIILATYKKLHQEYERYREEYGFYQNDLKRPLRSFFKYASKKYLHK